MDIKFLFVIILLTIQNIFSEARIIVDTPNVDFGYMQEEAISRDIHKVFILRNEGSDTLRISRVKPSCGCTSESHDSIIAPGAIGKISATIRKNTLHGGKFTKAIRVESNADNAPLIRLTLSGEILSPINFPKLFMRIVVDSSGKIEESFNITSDKKDLKISKVEFKEGKNANRQKGAELFSLTLNPSIKRTGKDNKNGFYTYNLKLSATDVKLSDYIIGKFVFITNHTKRKELDIRGMLAPYRK